MDDLISRQAAIDALMRLVEARRKWTTDASAEIRGIAAGICMIDALPSAQPDVAEIDAIEKALLDRCTINSYGGLTKADVKRELAKFRRKDNG